MMNLEAVVFDFGGVLIDWDPRRLYRKIFSDEKRMAYFLERVCSPHWNDRADRGESFLKISKGLIEEYPEFESEIAAYFSRWDEMLGGEISKNVDVLRSLHDQGMPLFGLSNWSGETFPAVRKAYEFFDFFQGIVLSGEEGVAKPDEAIFQILIDRYKLVPEKSLFIDDNAANIRAARSMGFHVFHETNESSLAEYLSEVQLAPPS